MTVDVKGRIRESVRTLLLQFWQMRNQIWDAPPTAESLIPIPVEVIARSVLKITLEEPEEIPSEREGFETAGFMDRAQNRIVIAQKHKVEYRRFTMAHEIAHWVMHPDVLYHRDRPLNGGEQVNPYRNRSEQEADIFAAELLMPSKPLIQCFQRAFGDCVDGRTPDAKLALSLSIGTQRRINELYLAEDLRYRSFLIAVTASFGSEKHFIPLASKFRVTPTAMAIRLEDLRLVI